ncbi:MAG TPA: 2-oxoacid:acceptor oxidoreductase family protein [Gemmatimonadales bacterium]|nr:2-oxoacid:acceptor oxidoreductase family protein [Gemmatimonadales bacterium]
MTRPDPIQVRFAGAGGQGVILAGVLLAEAGMHDGLHVVATQSYGPEARLGAAKTEVVLSRRPIVFPEVRVPDLIVCLSEDAYRKYARPLAPGGLRLVEESAVVAADPEREPGTVTGQFIATARALGSHGGVAANVVALGALVALSNVVSEASLRRALSQRVKPALRELNERALGAGLALVLHAISQ